MALARTLWAAVLALGLNAAAPVMPAGTAVAMAAGGQCAIWSVALEDDTTSKNLTASACSSTADDSAAVGFQCPGRPQLRYYPGDTAPEHLAHGKRVTLTFAVDQDSVAETMRYDEVNGVFWTTIGDNDPVFRLLQSGGPLTVTGDTLGTHTFRLLGSTAAISTVMERCGRHWPRTGRVTASVSG